MKRWTVVLLSAMLLLSVAGCGKKDNKETKTNNNLNKTKTNVAEEEYVNCFDVQSVVQSIMVNNETMGFPIEISKLKSTIAFGGLQDITPPKFFKGVLLDGETSIGAIEVYTESGRAEEDGLIYCIEVSEGSPWYLSIKGVTFGATIDEVKAAVGQPVFENGDVSDTYRLYYENCSDEYISFTFINGSLKTISFKYLPVEYRQG